MHLRPWQQESSALRMLTKLQPWCLHQLLAGTPRPDRNAPTGRTTGKSVAPGIYSLRAGTIPTRTAGCPPGECGQLEQLRQRQEQLNRELRNLAATAAQTGPSTFLVEEISARERELRGIADRLVTEEADSTEDTLENCEVSCEPT